MTTTNLEERARERFEAWWWTRHPDYTAELLKRTSKAGAYDSNWVNGMWLAWQAASTQVQAEARLEEAKWWNSLPDDKRHHSLVSFDLTNIPTVEACANLGCRVCSRIAALAAAVQPAKGNVG